MATAEQQARWRHRDKLRQRGLEEVRGIWARPEHHEAIKKMAERVKEDDLSSTFFAGNERK